MMSFLLAVCAVVAAGALGVLAIVVAMSAVQAKRTIDRLDRVLDRLERDADPMLQRVSVLTDDVGAVAKDIGAITTSVRDDMHIVNDAIASARDRLERAADMAEARLGEFNTLVGVVRDEVEDTFVSAASLVRAVRAGASALASPGPSVRRRPSRTERNLEEHARHGTDFASDAEGPATAAGELESHLESLEASDGKHGDFESPAAAFTTAPERHGPRTRGSRRRRGGGEPSSTP